MRKLIPSKISQQTIQSQPVNKLVAKIQASFSLIPKFLPFTSSGFLHYMAQPGKTESFLRSFCCWVIWPVVQWGVCGQKQNNGCILMNFSYKKISSDFKVIHTK